ncbi:MAG: hypothetical protein J0M12_11890 [Deltaproteobacteria bacterium]|nr:hypothetical protein [Deltaproteobacteria bacterium]
MSAANTSAPQTTPCADAPTGSSVATTQPFTLRVLKKLDAITILSAVLCVTYVYLFWNSVSAWWFNPHWSTDDALQQVFPFHSVHHPEIFKGDYVTEVMLGYLAPLHYALGYAITWICGDALMTAHYMMLIQVILSAGFLFLAVKKVAGSAPAFFAILWFFHTRHVIQRMTGGLPRGWAPVIFTGFLYFLVAGKHRALLALILAGCLLNPPAVFLVGVTYGCYLLIQLMRAESRAEYLPHFRRLLLCAPVFAVVTLYVTHRPESVGHLATYAEASSMPEFSRNGGRFSYLPFVPAATEMRSYAERTFFGKFNKPSAFWREYTLPIVIGLTLLVAAIGVFRKRSSIPLVAWCFLGCSILVYLLARWLAFALYVPDRHINIPFAIFWIFALTVGTWNALQLTSRSSLRRSWLSALGLGLIAFIVYSGSELNLSSNANFNWKDTKRGGWTLWVKKNTPETALIAGFPTFIDPVQLFGMRKGYATIETWHPFYSAYNEEMKRRLAISLRAHYARDLESLASILAAEKVDYFIFERQRFYPERLRRTLYFKTFQPLLDELTAGPETDYAYRQLPNEVDLERFPFMPYRDRLAVIVDVKKLQEYLAKNPRS